MNETIGGRINFFHASSQFRHHNINKIEKKSKKKIKKKKLHKTIKHRKIKNKKRKTKKRKKSKKRGGYIPTPITVPRPIFSQEFIEYHNNMFRDEPRAFIIAMMTHIRNRYVMDNLYSHGSLQDFRAYLYEKIHELLQYGTPEDVEFYIEERQPFFEIDQDGNELLSMENNLLEDLSSGNDHDYFVSMINLYRGLPRGLTTNEILGTD